MYAVCAVPPLLFLLGWIVGRAGGKNKTGHGGREEQ